MGKISKDLELGIIDNFPLTSGLVQIFYISTASGAWFITQLMFAEWIDLASPNLSLLCSSTSLTSLHITRAGLFSLQYPCNIMALSKALLLTTLHRPLGQMSKDKNC